MPIPKIIHQTYKDYSLPETYVVCKNEIIKLHPEFEYRFYTDADIDAFIQTNFPEYYQKFNELPRMIMKIDMFRYFLMYKYGGIYADMDYRMFKPFDLLNYTVVLPSSRENTDGTPSCLGNCFFASEPNHPFWKTLMDTLLTINRKEIDYTIDKNIDGHVLGTGPMFVYEMWTHYSKTNVNDIFVPKKSMFHPVTKNEKEYINRLKINGCYGIHMCTGLWRNNKL